MEELMLSRLPIAVAMSVLLCLPAAAQTSEQEPVEVAEEILEQEGILMAHMMGFYLGGLCVETGVAWKAEEVAQIEEATKALAVNHSTERKDALWAEVVKRVKLPIVRSECHSAHEQAMTYFPFFRQRSPF